jgi:hypothetical protein
MANGTQVSPHEEKDIVKLFMSFSESKTIVTNYFLGRKSSFIPVLSQLIRICILEV